MYILGITKLRQDLADDAMGEKQAFLYYLATAIVGALVFEAVANSPQSGGPMLPVDYLDGSLELVFTIVGITWCYTQNGAMSGKDFLRRIVPIGWVMWWRTKLFVLLPWTLLIAALNWYSTGSWGRPESETVVEIVIHNGINLFMFWRMGVHMKWVHEAKP